MPNFLADENITKPTLERLNKQGLTTVHVKYDLDKGGASDPEVLAIAKKKK